jgi:hypothetical protein
MKTIKIGKELDYILSLQKRKDAKQRILKVYDALLYKNTKADKKGYFQCPSKYLKKVSGQYTDAIDLLKEHKIIDFLSHNYDDKNLFDIRRKPFYHTEQGVCMSYKFLIDTELGYDYQIDTDFSKLYDDKKWYWRTRYSLLQLNFPPEALNITRCQFGRRLHTNITGNIGEDGSYKELLSGGDYWTIDAKTCHPRLLWMHLKETHREDDVFNHIFDNDLDFYDYILERMPKMVEADKELREKYGFTHTPEEIKALHRSVAKDAFMSWINGKGYVSEEYTELPKIFPQATKAISSIKSSNYKSLCSILQRAETNIFIDDLLNNIELDFCLTVHDSLIVKKQDVEYALDFCKSKYPEMVFIAKEITRR